MKKIVFFCFLAISLAIAGCTSAEETAKVTETETEEVTVVFSEETKEAVTTTEAVTVEVPEESIISAEVTTKVTTTVATTTVATTTEETTVATTTEATMALPDPIGVKELTRLEKEAKENGSLTVIIDPGHGIADPGAMNDENLGSFTEAKIDLAISNELKRILEERGYTVILTHDGVTKPYTEWDDGKALFGPSERCSFSNEQDANLFISIHCDSYPQNTSVNGVRIYYPVDTPFSTKLDKQYAKALSNAIESSFPEGKDIKLMAMYGKDCYTVLYKTVVPSVLVECGFITNKGDAENLLDEEWRTKFASALADGIDKYFE